MAGSAGSVERLALQIAQSLSSLGERFQPGEARTFFQSVGIRPPTGFIEALEEPLSAGSSAATALPALIAALQSAIDSDDVASIVETGKSLVSGIESVVTAVATLASSIDDLSSTLPGLTSDEQQALSAAAGELPKRLLDLLFVEVLVSSFPRILAAMEVTGLIEQVQSVAGANDSVTASIDRPKVHFERLSTLLKQPSEYLKQTFGWGEASFDGARLLGNLRTFLDFQVDIPGQLIEVPGLPLILEAYLFNFAVDDQSSPPGLSVDLRLSPQEQFTLSAAITDDWNLDLTLDAEFDKDIRATISPPFELALAPSANATAKVELSVGVSRNAASGPLLLIGQTDASRLEIGKPGLAVGFKGSWQGGASGVTAEPRIRADLKDGRAVLGLKGGDGFIAKVLGDRSLEVKFDVGLDWSPRSGFKLRGAGELDLTLPVSETLGPIHLSALHFALVLGDSGLSLQASASAEATLGPIAVTVDRVGVEADLTFPDGGGNLGPLQLDLGFKAPTGMGVSVNAGGVSGGGFLSLEPKMGRYSGAIQLSIYSVAVSAFGLVETKSSDGGKSFSFVIVIGAEFPAIQLGFGFTLLGVGGLVAVNRMLDSQELAKLVLAGTSGELLFPKDLVANAPAILRDLAAVFPAREGRYVFGPIAKLGWGTPTLVRGEIGVVLELPGPVLTILGEVRIRLPKEERALLSFNLSVEGTLDFPRKTFALDAALHDSHIVKFLVSGQMAMRLRWGEDPNFVLSVGGFHPAYTPPRDFPKLQPLSLDLGQSKDVRVSVTGFFAITANTLQIGGTASLHANRSGITLDASVSVKALFTFTPFSFDARIDASVKVGFHGYGPSVHMSGSLSGPTPWRARGELCVSVIIWDACLGFDETFGERKDPESLQEIDPWLGSDGPPLVLGLRSALQDPGSWASEPPTNVLAVVSLAQGAEKLVDPLGALSVRQRVVPLETATSIERFGAAKTPAPVKFSMVSAVLERSGGDVPLQKLGKVEDFFAPAQFFKMDDAKKLSAKSFDKYQAGYRLGANTHDLELGSKAPRHVTYKTLVVAADGSATPTADYDPTSEHVDAAATTSIVAHRGTLRLGTRAYVDRRRAPPVTIVPRRYVFADTSLLRTAPAAPPPATRAESLILLTQTLASTPERRPLLQVVALHELA